ncbi:hypothetical protein EGR_10185 [Echinococcus granulosus]|uniref:Uncharacterized protein n=1 Tax=Echinococcus granulosus TaxID=6210 RepID=W6U1J7_ECHGR|nr:hypothetical protein EGR_10185 [Echinococcus granulosus]EUB54950.1 hypothetical protein EGR_10185 [Echinococcus granulosus]
MKLPSLLKWSGIRYSKVPPYDADLRFNVGEYLSLTLCKPVPSSFLGRSADCFNKSIHLLLEVGLSHRGSWVVGHKSWKVCLAVVRATLCRRVISDVTPTLKAFRARLCA